MKGVIIAITLALFGVNCQAQEEAGAYEVSEEYDLWNLHKADTAYVFAEVAYVRASPSLNATVVDSLLQGNQVRILSDPYKGNTIKGFHAPWHEITYIKDKQRHKGFIWLGLLALNASKNKEGELFISGFNKFKASTESQSSYYDAELKAFSSTGKLLTRAAFQANVAGQIATEVKLLSSMGLENIKNIHRLSFLSEACGIPTYAYYFAWNGTDLIRFPDKMNVSDAGVFYHEETILFPAEHKRDQQLIYKNIVTGENTNGDLENPKIKETKSQRIYRWDGKVISE